MSVHTRDAAAPHVPVVSGAPRGGWWAQHQVAAMRPRGTACLHPRVHDSSFSFSVCTPQLDYIDPRAVQLGSLLVRGLTTLVLVNSACGFPWRMSDFMPWNVFDGKLFHQKYLQAEKGYTVEALVEQNRSRLTKFHTLKSVVCKACVKENRRIISRQLWRSHQPGRWGRQGSGSHRTSSGYSRAGQGQHWRDQGPGNRQYEPDHWRRHSSSSGWSN
ncbi:constitutive coactivator of peroxisome proliferator-activated receptor gamma [Eumetopias jubatus]|uniref:constitutive coactivator of peroxisome proliferator-activated receptor gamma n=1 Tax=Eumetopias jubatus TaxID=34886 RepID=UPI0010162AC7|nr:constitutive coactivator of peroxisome proliferator-activated receptor gamma [Eumetopias jubatus]